MQKERGMALFSQFCEGVAGILHLPDGKVSRGHSLSSRIHPHHSDYMLWELWSQSVLCDSDEESDEESEEESEEESDDESNDELHAWNPCRSKFQRAVGPHKVVIHILGFSDRCPETEEEDTKARLLCSVKQSLDGAKLTVRGLSQDGETEKKWAAIMDQPCPCAQRMGKHDGVFAAISIHG